MTFPVHDDTDTPCVSATGHHADVSSLEFDKVHDLVGRDVNTDCVVNLDEGVWVPDGPAVVGVEDRNVVGQHRDLQDTTQLVLCLLTSDPVDAEPALDVVDEPEVLIDLEELDDVHETGWESVVSPDLAVDLD